MNKGTIMVGVSGGIAVGKTTLINELGKNLPNSQRL